MCRKWDPLVEDVDDQCVYYIADVCLCLQCEDWQKECPTQGKDPEEAKNTEQD